MIVTHFFLILIITAVRATDKKLDTMIYNVCRWFQPEELKFVIEGVVYKPDNSFWSLPDILGLRKEHMETDNTFTYDQSDQLLNFLTEDANGPRLRVGQQYNLAYELTSPRLPREIESLQLLYRILSDDMNHELAHRDPSPLSHLFIDLPLRPDRLHDFVWILAMAGACPTPELIRLIQQEIYKNPGKESNDLRTCLEILKCCKIARL